MISRPVRFGLCGLGGYAATICQTLMSSPCTRLLAVYEPDYAAHPELVAELDAAGIRRCASYAELLSEPIEAVWLPLPIHLHRSFTEQAVAKKIAVMCEKPAAGIVQDIDGMIAARDRAGVPVAIGFQQLSDPNILTLKRRLVAGDFGAIQSISLTGCWPRSSAYYGRNSWAGKLRFGDTWVLDSPLANAMNHYLQLALFLGGKTVRTSAVGHRIEAELYRANEIENFDTCSIRVEIDRQISVLLLMTHACQRVVAPAIRIRCANGEARVVPEDRIDCTIGGTVTSMSIRRDVREQLVTAFHDYLRGIQPSTSQIATLEIARAPLEVVNAVAMTARVNEIPADSVRTKTAAGGTLRYVEGIEDAFEACETNEQMLHTSGRFPWTVVPSTYVMQPPNYFVQPKT